MFNLPSLVNEFLEYLEIALRLRQARLGFAQDDFFTPIINYRN